MLGPQIRTGIRISLAADFSTPLFRFSPRPRCHRLSPILASSLPPFPLRGLLDRHSVLCPVLFGVRKASCPRPSLRRPPFLYEKTTIGWSPNQLCQQKVVPFPQSLLTWLSTMNPPFQIKGSMPPKWLQRPLPPPETMDSMMAKKVEWKMLFPNYICCSGMLEGQRKDTLTRDAFEGSGMFTPCTPMPFWSCGGAPWLSRPMGLK